MTRKIFLPFFFIFFTLSGYSQLPFFQQYFLLKKNEPVQVNIVFQDKEGFIWFGTNNGLFKFNGISYQQFTVADSLPDNDITAIAQDSTGRIWTGHRSGKLAFFEKGKVHLFDPPEGSAVKPVSDILFDSRGILWYATLNDGLYYYVNGRLYRLDEQEGMPDIYIYDILEDRNGKIWAGTDGGVAVCSPGKDSVSIEVLDYSDGLPDNIIKRLAIGEDGRIFMATEDAGMVVFNPSSRKFRPALKESWTHGSINDFLLKDEKIWISTARDGLMVYDKVQKDLKQYNQQKNYTLPEISGLLADRQGNIWAASKSGVVRTSGDYLEFIESLTTSNSPNVISVTTGLHGDIWFSTREGLFRRSVDPSGKVSIQKQLAHTPFQQYRIISLYVDDSGFVWAGLYGEGLLRINPFNGQVRHFRKQLRNGNILHITGRKNVVWLATLGGGEKITILPDGLDITNYHSGNGLSSDFIYEVFVDSRDRVWFATDGKGIDMLDADGFHHFEEGLPSKVVYGFAEDTKGQLWVNCQGNGIFKFNGEKFLPLAADLRDNNINAFAADKAGNLIIMHDLGIDIYNVNNGRIRYFGEESGINDNRATLNAVSNNGKGKILIGTNKGIIQYTANKAITQTEAHIVIDAVKVFNEKIDLAENPVLRYDENSLSINFYGLWYQNPELLHFQYKMDNYDEQWISTGDNTATYSRLPPGEYTFRVKVSDNDDFRGANEASIRFGILPPFWRTFWFYGICLVTLVAAGYAFIRYREKKLKEDKLILEAKVEERTMEIQRKTEEIQAQNEEIMAQAEEIKGINENLEMLVKQRTAELERKNKALEEYAFINAHKLRSPLASILGLINLISKTKLDDEAKVINEHLQNSANELDDIVNSITKAIERGDG